MVTDDQTTELTRHITELGVIQGQLPSPEMITDSARGECYLRGNPSAYIALAAKMLEAAQGKDANFVEFYWLRNEAWSFDGLIVQPTIDTYTKQRARFRWTWNRKSIVPVGIVLLLIVCLGMGAYTIIHSVLHLFIRTM